MGEISEVQGARHREVPWSAYISIGGAPCWGDWGTTLFAGQSWHKEQAVERLQVPPAPAETHSQDRSPSLRRVPSLPSADNTQCQVSWQWRNV